MKELVLCQANAYQAELDTLALSCAEREEIGRAHV